MNDTFHCRGSFSVDGKSYKIARLSALSSRFQVARLPWSLRLLLENLLRHEDGVSVKADDIEALASWDPKRPPEREIAFRPARVLMQDFTGVPAVVDLAAMRDAMKDLGGDPARINPLQPVELVIDHSVQVDASGSPQAQRINTELEFQRNAERYSFLKWGQSALEGLKVVPPDTGIVHQVNLEYLARVVMDGRRRLCAPRHSRRNRFAHDDDQWSRRARLGSRWDRGRSGDARTTRVHARSRRRRRAPGRPADRGHDRDRPRAASDRDAAQARRGGEVRRVLRCRARRARARRSSHDREHGAGVRGDVRALPRGSLDARLSTSLGSLRGERAARRGVLARARSLRRAWHARALVRRIARARSRDDRAESRRPEATAGPRRAPEGRSRLPESAARDPRRRRTGRSRPEDRGAARRAHVLARSRFGRDRRDHELYQYFQSLGDDRRRLAREEGRSRGTLGPSVGQDEPRAGIEGRDELPGTRGPAAVPRQAWLRRRGLRMRRASATRGLAPEIESDRRRGLDPGLPFSRGNPQLRRARPRKVRATPRVAAARRGLRARGRREPRSFVRAPRYRIRRQAGTPATYGRRVEVRGDDPAHGRQGSLPRELRGRVPRR